MARYFSLYPSGLVGLGLLLLRLGVALSLSAAWLQPSAPGLPALVASMTIGAALAVGLLCRAGAAAAILFLLAGRAGIADGWSLELAAQVIDACALALLGGGAYSIDAILFGRRTIDLPHRNSA